MNILHEMMMSKQNLGQSFFSLGLVFPQFVIGEGVKWELTDLGREVNQILLDYDKANSYIPMRKLKDIVNNAKRKLIESVNSVIKKGR